MATDYDAAVDFMRASDVIRVMTVKAQLTPNEALINNCKEARRRYVMARTLSRLRSI